MCVPSAKPVINPMKINQRSAPGLSACLSQRKIAQKVRAVKNELSAYTSASTALNQKLSMKVLLNAATTPAAIIRKLRFWRSCEMMRPAKCVVIQKVNITQPALDTADSIFTQKPTFSGVLASMANKRPIIKNKGAPGG